MIALGAFGFATLCRWDMTAGMNFGEQYDERKSGRLLLQSTEQGTEKSILCHEGGTAENAGFLPSTEAEQ